MERLETKSVYHTVAEVRLGESGGWASLGLKATGFDASFRDGQVLHFDLEGRLTRVATPNVQWRRGLSHRTVCLRKRPGEAGGGLEVRLLDREESDRLVDDASLRLSGVREALRRGQFALQRGKPNRDQAVQELESAIARAAAFDARAAREDFARFQSLYGDIPILPPDQYGAFVLLATEGCAYNQCTFCGFYRGVPFRRKTPEEFRSHLRQAAAYHGSALAARRGVFLGQANALVGPRPWREQILGIVNGEFLLPSVDAAAAAPAGWQGSPRPWEGITAFVDAFTGVHLGEDEFAAMRRWHLRRLYLGVETGDRQLLAWLRKPATPEDMLRTVEAARRGGVHVGVIVLLGAGGERYFQAHVDETIGLLRRMPLGRGDYVYLSPLVAMPGAEHGRQLRDEQIEPLSPSRMAEQQRLIRAGLAATARQGGPYVARYDVAHFVY